MYPGGLRREEVVSLNLSDYNPESGALTVWHGKGNKARVSYINPEGVRAMGDWLAIRGGEGGPLLWPINKGGQAAAQEDDHPGGL